MRSFRAIENILKEQIAGYKTLLALLQRERECLVSINAEGIEEISKEKDTTVMRLRLLEEERQRLAKKIAEDNGMSQDLNLLDLGRLSGDDSFSMLRSNLLSLVQSIEEMNKLNGILIDRSLRYFQTNTNFFSVFMAPLASGSKGMLLSKET